MTNTTGAQGAAPLNLWPPPRRVRATGSALVLYCGTRPRVRGQDADARVVRALEAAFAPLGAGEGEGERVDVELLVEVALGQEAYRLGVGADGIQITASGAEGAFRAAATLAQLVRAATAPPRGAAPWSIAGVVIDDAPDFAERGFMLDVSRDRIPMMPALLHLVDRLAELKYNRLQLYFEHTFAYAGHEQVWRDASAFTPDEIRQLDAYCAERFLELVPNQQSLGHMHRWLVLPRYAQLAEVPEGIEHAFSVEKEPFSLAPTNPGSFALLEELYDQLLACFSSDTINVGLDETFDVGLGASKAECESKGVGRVYLETLKRVHALVTARGKRMQFWGDVIVNHPDLVPELPPDAVALEWGYEAGHPFEAHAARFAESGLEFHVCPGTSSWQSFGGRLSNAHANLEEAARHGLAAGASGYLVTDWGDFGHWQPPSVSWPGILLGASRGWNAHADPEGLERGLALHVLESDQALAEALVALANVHEAAQAPAVNGSALFFLLRYAHQPLPIERAAELNVPGLDTHAAALDAVRGRLADGARGGACATIAREIEWAADTLGWSGELARARLAAGEGSHVADVPAQERRRLARDLAPLIERHRSIWLETSRPGGLAESAARLEHIHAMLQKQLA
ncbi:MAG: family 20 glycosylhydrolase [bacterium]|nr:family 20 glycosylhydrolase [bacterium]